MQRVECSSSLREMQEGEKEESGRQVGIIEDPLDRAHEMVKT
jgi:hypothetical protein